MMIKLKAKVTEDRAQKPWKDATYQWHAYACEANAMGVGFETITIEWQLFGETETETIASVNISRIPANENPRTNLLYKEPCYETAIRMDDYSMDLGAVAADIFYCNNPVTATIKKQLLKNDLFYVDTIYVKPEYRGSGFGANILKKLYRILRAHTRESNPVVVLLPLAIELEEFSAERTAMTKRLECWYKRNGFTPVGGKYHNTLVLKKSLSPQITYTL